MKKWLVGLVCVGLGVAAVRGQDPAVWFNEICYDPAGTDVAGSEWIEVAGPAGVDLSSYAVVRYNGNGGVPYGTTVLTGAIDDEGCGFGAVDLTYATQDSLQNGSPDGLALVYVDGGGATSLVQFVSYEGSFTGVGGPADGVVSVSVGTQIQTNDTLQLVGEATNYSGYVWTTNGPSKGSLNAGQTIPGCTPAPVTNVSFAVAADSVAEEAGTYLVAIVKSLAEGDVGGEIVLSGTATEGAAADYTVDATTFTLNGATTSATITVTLNDDAELEAAETIEFTLANVTGGQVVAPAVFTLTINASDMPIPDQLIDFETVTGFSSYAAGTSTVSGVLISHSQALRGTSASDPKNGAASARIRYLSTNVGFIATAEAFAQPISQISFVYADYGTDNTTTFKVQASSDGASWQDVGEAAYDPDGATLLAAVIDSLPANMTYFQFITLGGEGDRVCIDDIGLWFGAATFGVTFDQPSGFVVEQGASAAITATAANGTEPYGYAWTSTLDGAYYSALDSVFTILATAPVGDYSAQVVATDGSSAAVTNTIDFSVKAPYAIAVVTNGTGTVTTTPAGQAVEGTSVAIAATPGANYLLESLAVTDAALNPVAVVDGAFTMPAADVIVTATFVYHEASALIISEVADPGDNASGGRFVELYNAGAVEIDLAAGTWYLARQVNGGTTWGNVALTGTVAPGATYVVAGSTNFPAAYPAAPAPDQTSGTIDSNGDDGYFLFSGGNNTAGILEDAYGVLNEDGTGLAWDFTDARGARNADVTAGTPTWTAAEWTITAPANVADMTPGVHPDGPVSFGVTFDQPSGFTVEEGTTDVVVATAANGTAPYSYSWTSTLGEDYRTAVGNEFTILATAPLGDYSAEVVATDSSDPVQSVTNSLNFSVVTPPPTYAIAIVTNMPENGTVTTTPETEAAAGETVTVTATPVGGYAVESIVVNGGAVTVTGTTFVMPAGPATVTVTFMVYEAPDALIDFEDYTGSYAWNEYVAGGVTWTMTNVFAGNTLDDAKNGTTAGRFENNRGGVGNPAKMTSTAFAEPVTKITFWYANYGVNDGGAFKVQVSDDGATWTDVGEAEYNPDSKILVPGVIESIPAGMTYVQFITTAGTAQRVNVDDIGLFFGAPVFSVSVDKSNGFTVNEGQSDTITATAANGTAPYGYAWTSTLGGAFYVTNGNVFTILATAPTGSYSATVTATDAALATAQRTVTFSVVGLAPGQPAVLISGSLSGTVGVELSLGVSVTNETANDWFIYLRDPDGLDDYSYGFDGSTFTLTPAKTGTYVLTVEAVTGSGNVSNTVNLAIGGGGGGDWQIANAADGGAMFYTTSNQTILIVLPTNYTLTAVYGTDSSSAGLNNLGQGLGSTLTPGLDYTWTPATRTISVLSGVTNRRVLRIGAEPQ